MPREFLLPMPRFLCSWPFVRNPSAQPAGAHSRFGVVIESAPVQAAVLVLFGKVEAQVELHAGGGDLQCTSKQILRCNKAIYGMDDVMKRGAIVRLTIAVNAWDGCIGKDTR